MTVTVTVTAQNKEQKKSIMSGSSSPCFLHLPDELLRDVMHDWLNFWDLCNFDTAVCAHGARGGFLQLLSSDTKTVLGYNSRVPSRRAFSWIGLRGIKLNSLVIHRDVEEEYWDNLRSLALDTSCIDRLQSLRVEHEALNNHEDLTTLINQCRKTLKHLTLFTDRKSQYIVTVARLDPYIARCTELCTIDADEISENGLKMIFNGCRKLEIVRLADCNSFTDASLVTLADSCSRIKALNLDGRFGSNSNLSEATLVRCFRSWPLLESLQSPRNPAFTDAVVAAICESCPLMKSLSLYGTAVTDASIYMIAETYPGLKKIYLSATTTPDAVKVLVEKCNKLKTLGVFYNAMIDDNVLVSVAENCKDLEFLDVKNCPLVSAVGLGFVASHCKKLTKINVGDVAVSANTQTKNEPLLASLRVTYPNISII